MTFILIWWFLSARKWFKGPKYVIFVRLISSSFSNRFRVNIEHRLLDGAAAALDGKLTVT